MPDLKRAIAETSDRSTGSALQGYRLELHRFLRSRIRRSQDFDDIAQEVLARFLRANKEVLRKPLPYLFGIAAHVVREFRLRSVRDQECLSFDSDTADHVTENPWQPPPIDLVDQLSLQEQLLEALKQLPATQRSVLLMVKFEGKSHSEVAQSTGLSVNTIEKYVVEARAKLKTIIWDQ